MIATLAAQFASLAQCLVELAAKLGLLALAVSLLDRVVVQQLATFATSTAIATSSAPVATPVVVWDRCNSCPFFVST